MAVLVCRFAGSPSSGATSELSTIQRFAVKLEQINGRFDRPPKLDAPQDLHLCLFDGKFAEDTRCSL